MKRILPEENMSWQRPILSISDNGTATKGNRYIVGESPAGEFSGFITDTIAWYDGDEWQIDIPEEGWCVYDLNQSELLFYVNGPSGDYWYYFRDIFGSEGGGGGAVAWGAITGTLSAQTDLQAALDAKLNLTGGTLTGALSITLATGNSLIVDTNVLVVDATNNRIGSGTAAPEVGWDFRGPSVAASQFRVMNTMTSASGSGAGLLIVENDGAYLANGDRIGYALFGGSTAGSIANGAGFVAYAGQNWALNTYGTRFNLETIANGSNARLARICISEVDGNVGIGTTDFDGTPAYGRLVVKGSTADGSTNIFVGRDSAEANVITIDTDGTINANKIINQAPLRLKNYTVATLPAGTQGDVAFVTNALAPAFLTAVVGGGAIVTPVFYDGTNWVAF